MMQFTAVVLMLLLTVKLLFLRGRHIKSRQSRQARRLMAGGTMLLALHFALQLTMGLRLMGVTQSVMLNLAMLIPASYFFARAVLLLQRRGELSLTDQWTGPAVWMVTMAMLAVAALTDGQPLLSDTLELRMAEKAGAVLYMLMQGYYTWRHTASLVAMRHALSDYYDRDTDGMLRWMQYSIIGLMLLALMVPMAIFGTGTWMLIIAFAIYFFLFYLVDSFCFYLVSPAPERVQAAERHATEVKEEACREQAAMSSHKGTEEGTDAALLSPEVTHEVEQAVAAWLARGGYRQTGLLQPQAAQDIGISRYRLTAWLHQRGVKYTEWMAQLRVEEAKRTIAAHPDWGNDAVAQHCGFADRTVLQRTFKKIEGITPQKYMENLSD
jgi:AraC-like DNA-binding protein